MPYTVRKSGLCPKSRPWSVFKEADDTKVGGCHATKYGAVRQLAAIESAEKAIDELRAVVERRA